MANKSSSAINLVLAWLFGGTAFVTLIFYTSASDPFNAVKFWALLLVASFLIGRAAPNFWSDFRSGGASRVEKISLLLVGVFLLTLLIGFFTTDVKFTALFGAYQRRTGLLAYVGFSILFLAAMKLSKLESVRSLQVVIFGTR